MRTDEDRDPFIDLIAGIGPGEREPAILTTTAPPPDDRETSAPTDPATAG